MKLLNRLRFMVLTKVYHYALLIAKVSMTHLLKTKSQLPQVSINGQLEVGNGLGLKGKEQITNKT